MSQKKLRRKCVLQIDGMHCASCELEVERRVGQLKGVTEVTADVRSGVLEVVGNIDNIDDLSAEIDRLLTGTPYSVSRKAEENSGSRSFVDYLISFALGFVIIAGYILLQVSNVLKIDINSLSYGTYFFLGVVASLSSCAALVGGILLSMGAQEAKEEKDKRKQFLYHAAFHLSRLIVFFVLGGLLGLIGANVSLGVVVSVLLGFVLSNIVHEEISKHIAKKFKAYLAVVYIFSLGTLSYLSHWLIGIVSSRTMIPANLVAQALLIVIVSVYMSLLAMSLLEFFDLTYKFQLRLPKFVTKFVLKSENFNNLLSPVILGVGSFFLPCGFTLTMQGLALDSGSFWSGGTTMLVFALGTLPVLALISFSSLEIGSNQKLKSIFFKTSGILLTALVLYNVTTMLRILGFAI